uniref:Uncharacterized protein n=1 Tax=Fagus sylvatica TaxID=28930 RepID=A0A2N9HD33_FAGSY
MVIRWWSLPAWWWSLPPSLAVPIPTVWRSGSRPFGGVVVPILAWRSGSRPFGGGAAPISA